MLEKEFEALIQASAKSGGGAKVSGTMTSRERFLRCMHFQSVDRIPHWEFGYWDETIRRFQAEGLPAKYNDNWSVEEYFGCEHPTYVPLKLGTINTRKQVVVEERGNTKIVRDGLGTLQEVISQGAGTIPHYLEFPVKDRASWQAFRDEFLTLDLDKRLPAANAEAAKDAARSLTTPEAQKSAKAGKQSAAADSAGSGLPALGAKLLRSEVPVGVSIGSYLGWIRNWVGFENIALMFYDDPELVEEMVAHCSGITLKVLERALPHVSADFAAGWEDVCYNSGPICSPEMFNSIVMPHLRPVLKLLRTHGVDVIWTDCDGDITKLVPLWLEAGQNCMFPIEVRGGTDPVALRKQYGHDILLVGGFDKMALLKGKPAILAELKRLEPTVADGGFIPHVDHRVQADVGYDTYRYFVREKLAMCGWKKEDVEAIEPLRGVK
ncbi:MAG TPA: uroporphyrinogen decarboxylase family protein [Planctomycetota bacterium]|nr:uroporphyrinogen decarboxylase family protein [Planctomycetota bacterium]